MNTFVRHFVAGTRHFLINVRDPYTGILTFFSQSPCTFRLSAGIELVSFSSSEVFEWAIQSSLNGRKW